MAKRTIRFMSGWTGVTVISTETRDKILDSAPWLASYFLATEKAKRQTEKRKSVSDTDLRYDNPYLENLRQRYSHHPANDHNQWRTSDVEAVVDLPFFRADNLYVFQSRRYPPWLLYATSAYVTQIDRLGLLNILKEDDAFGAEVFDFHGKVVSRDLLDSIIEINFLDRHLGFSNGRAVNVLDVGAGYGRLAHRMATALPNLKKYYCVDAVPESTFISDYYLKFRKVTDRCTVVPLDKLNEVEPIDLAINIHSFAECRNRVVDWWLHQLCEMRIPWLFIATSPSLGLTSHENDGRRKDFRQLIERSGFVLSAYERKFESAPVLQDYGLYPADYYLFRRA
jgi:putative sugar O-methyltransferase